jgi:DNA-binding HxlR family transcriptional regulator
MRRLEPDTCGFNTALSVIGRKWKPAILWELTLAPRRFSELFRLLPPISEKVLAAQLKEMEADRIIRRTVRGQVPPHVEYSVTDLGLSLNDAVVAMSHWGKAHEQRRAEEAAAAEPAKALP